METEKVRVIWNGAGGELDAVTVSLNKHDDLAVTNALIKLVRGNIVNAGDSFIVEEIA